MALSGLVGASAVGGLEDLIAQQLLKEKFAEQQRAQQAQEEIQRSRLAQDAAQHGDVMKVRGREQDFLEQAYQDETQQQTIAGMRKVNADNEAKFTRLTNEDEAESVLDNPGAVSPLRRIVALDRIGVKAGGDDVATPEERRAATEADISNYARKMGAGANAQAAAEARYREPKPGGPNAAPSPYAQERNTRTRDAATKLMGKVGPFTTGVGSLLANLPATDARDFAAELNTLKSNIAFNELAQMREASKTGGALGAVSDNEMRLLESTLGALDAGQSPTQFKAQLQQILDSLDRFDAARSGGAASAPALAPSHGGSVEQRPIPGIPGAMAESTDGGKTWKRVK